MSVAWLTIFGDDDVTPLVGSVNVKGGVTDPSFSTDKSHARGWLDQVSHGVSQQIDLIEGTASIGEFTVTVVDKRTVATDQSTGYVTSLLATNDGYSAVTMRRAVYQLQGPDGKMHVVQNGVITSVKLNADCVSYDISIRDMNERARKTRLFNRVTGPTPRYTSNTTTVLEPLWDGSIVSYPSSAYFKGDPIPGPLPPYGTCLFPAGPLYGYGRAGNLPNVPPDPFNTKYLIKPIAGKPATGKFVRDTHGYAAYRGVFQLTGAQYPITSKAYNAGYPSVAINAKGNVLPYLVYQDVLIFWRKAGSTNWHRIENMPLRDKDTYPATAGSVTVAKTYGQNMWTAATGASTSNSTPTPTTLTITFRSQNHQDLPPDQTVCDIIVMDAGPPSDDSPLYIEDTWGQLLADIYDGYYSVGYDGGPTRVIPIGSGYDPILMGQLATSTQMLHFRKTAPVDDALAWLPENMYKPFGAVPAFNRDGLLAPIFYVLPDTNAPLVTIDDTNATFDNSSWELSSDGAVNAVHFTTQRENIINGKVDSSVDVEYYFLDTTAEALGGEKEVKYAPETLTALIQSSDGNVASVGDTTSGLAPLLASQRWNEVHNRFRYGNQQVVLTCDRSDPDVEAIVAGTWCLVGASWLPDFGSGTRGMNRLMQAMSTRDIDQAWKEVTLSDAGPAGQPAQQPTFDAPASSTTGSIVINVTALQAGTKAVAYFNLSTTSPNQSDSGWHFMGSVSTPGLIVSLPMAAGAVVWVRLRAEFNALTQAPLATPIRSSLWTTPVSVTIADVPQVTSLSLTGNGTGVLTLAVDTSANTRGLRIYYAQKVNDGTEPNYVSYLEVAATPNATQTITLPMVALHGQSQYVTVVPFAGWNASTLTVSGAAGAYAGAQTSTGADGTTTPITGPIYPLGRITTAETATLGTLIIDVSDPQHRLTLVEVTSQSGNGNWSGWARATGTANPYSGLVTLIAKQPSKIGYRIWGTDVNNVNSVLDEGLVTFSIGGQPTKPELREVVATDGTFEVNWNGDTDTNYIKIAASIVTYPTPAVVRAAIEQPGQNGTSLPLDIGIGGGATTNTIMSGQVVYLSAFAYNADDLEGEFTTAKIHYTGIGATPLPDVTIGTPIRGPTFVRFPFSWDGQTTDIVAWYKVFATGTQPSVAFNVARASGAVALPPISVAEGLMEIVVPLAASTDYAVLSLVGHDPMNQRGPVVVSMAQGTGAVTVAAPTAASNTSVTSTLITNSVTTPSTALTTWKIRTYKNGYAFGSAVAVTLAGAHAQTITYPTTYPSTTSFGYSMLDASGNESSVFTIGTAVVTPAPASAPAPSLSIVYDTDGQLIDVTVTPAGGTSGNITWEYWSSSTSGGVYSQDTSAQVFSPVGTAVVHLQSYSAQTSIARIRYVKVRGTAGGVTGSYTSVVAVGVPARTPTGGGGGGAVAQ